MPNAIKKVEDEIKRSGANFISGKGLIKMQNKKYKAISPTKLTLKRMLYRSSIIFQSSTFFSRELFNSTKGFNSSNHTCWDYELYIDLLKSGAKHHLMSENLAVFRMHKESITGSQLLNTKYQNDLSRIFKKYRNRKFNYLDKILFYLLKSQNIFLK